MDRFFDYIAILRDFGVGFFYVSSVCEFSHVACLYATLQMHDKVKMYDEYDEYDEYELSSIDSHPSPYVVRTLAENLEYHHIFDFDQMDLLNLNDDEDQVDQSDQSNQSDDDSSRDHSQLQQ